MSFKDIFKKKEPKSKKEEAKETVLGFIIIAAIAWFFFSGNDDQNSAAQPDEPATKNAQASSTPQDQTAKPVSKPTPTIITLADYKRLPSDKRKASVAAAVAAFENSAADLESFTICMNEFASTKSESLIFKDVIGWCEAERQNNRARFESHFDELASDESNLDSTAVVMCKDFVKSSLVSPSTADFPWLDHTVQKLGQGTYIVRSYVDAQNKFGAMIRANYSCEVKYRGQGDEFLNSSWELRDLQIN